ncbi:MAG: hypothetical protein JXR96_11865 [Deltaproteobacteria bacterium]|nr:hypothetical protein [Deltaproteobacteria bacterium]
MRPSPLIALLACSLLPACETTPGSVPAGLIAMFEQDCPAGWSRVESLDGRFARGAVVPGRSGGAETHTHAYDLVARTSTDGEHAHELEGGEPVQIDRGIFGHLGIHEGYLQAFEEGGRSRSSAPRAMARTAPQAGHDHLISVQGDSEPASHLPPYQELVFCRKD